MVDGESGSEPGPVAAILNRAVQAPRVVCRLVCARGNRRRIGQQPCAGIRNCEVAVANSVASSGIRPKLKIGSVWGQKQKIQIVGKRVRQTTEPDVQIDDSVPAE